MAISSTAAVLNVQFKAMLNGGLNLSNTFAAVLCNSVSGVPTFAISTTTSIDGRINRSGHTTIKNIGLGHVTQTTSGTMYFVTTAAFTFTATSGNLVNAAGKAPKWCYICPFAADNLQVPLLAFQLSSVSIVATQITVQMPTNGWFEISRNVA